MFYDSRRVHERKFKIYIIPLISSESLFIKSVQICNSPLLLTVCWMNLKRKRYDVIFAI